ncbi:MAG: SRPBCC family protein [Myxococcota bacterium]
MTTAYFVVDPDVRNASAPPPELYINPDWYSQIIDGAWRTGWQWLVPVIGQGRSTDPSAVPIDLSGEPLVLTRDDAGNEHLLSNVCTHRGALLVDGSCSVRQLRCPYHARTFDLQGRARHSPGFADTSFPEERDHLPRASLAQFGPWRFGSVAPALSFETWTQAMTKHLDWFDWSRLVHRESGHRVHEIDVNWALYVENYLEGLHIPFVHPGLNDLFAPGTYRTELLPHGALQMGLARDGAPAHEPPAGALDHGSRVAAYYIWLFPGTMLNIYPWGVSMNQVEPVEPTKTRVHYRTWVLDDADRDPDIDTVEDEDQAIVQRVQRAMGSTLYRGGRYSPTEEQGSHHFHWLLSNVLQPS